MSVLLIHPPVSKPCEPPPGLARLAGALAAAGATCRVWDAGLEGLLHLINLPLPAQDTWTRRAVKNREANLAALRSPETFHNLDRYIRRVKDISRLLAAQAALHSAELTLADYSDGKLSPVRSSDLVRAAEQPESNPFYSFFCMRLRHLLAEDAPRVIGLSVNFLSQALTAWAMMGFLKREGCRAKIVLGGGLITSWLRRPGLPNPFAGFADHVVDGPGEEMLLHLAGGTALAAHACAPDYSGFPLDRYFSPGRILPFSTAAGCYWGSCSFCPEQAEGSPYRPLPVAAAGSQIRQLVGQYKPRLLHLVDNALSPSFLKSMIKNPPGPPWYGFARVTPELQDEGFCRQLRESGCMMLQLGLESGDDAVLAALSKGLTVADAARALRTIKRAGIGTYVYLLFGTPAETRQSAQRTLDFTVAQSGQIDFLNLAIFNMPVNAADAASLATGAFYDGDLALYTGFKHPHGWGRSLVRRFLDREFKRHPAIAPIVRRDPPVFTSNHAPFFLQP
jgi:hypothetical protein